MPEGLASILHNLFHNIEEGGTLPTHFVKPAYPDIKTKDTASKSPNAPKICLTEYII